MKNLTKKEIEVVKSVVEGHSNRFIANKLLVTEQTIKFHLTNIYKKMDVKSRAQLIIKILNTDIVPKVGEN